ncbi:MAG: GNAT family N-acetyltransferase [Pseudomonadota bacterium]
MAISAQSQSNAGAVTIAPARPGDAAAREALLDRVMGPIRFLRASEKLRQNNAALVDLAAKDEGGRLVGTVRLWPIEAPGLTKAVLLGPLCVAGAYQGAGVGAQLVEQAVLSGGASGSRF